MAYTDHHGRTLLKSIGYIILTIIADWVVSLIITKQISLSLELTFYSNLVGLVIYFFHERAWNKVHWGRSKLEIDLIEKK